jgi:hypothetical protein
LVGVGDLLLFLPKATAGVFFPIFAFEVAFASDAVESLATGLMLLFFAITASGDFSSAQS